MRVWYEVDVSGKILGRVATQIAQLLMGKGKINNIPNRDDGDFVVVLNAAEVEVSGKKNKQKEYVRHTGYPGGLRKETFEQLQKRCPEKIIVKAVKGMLPKNKLGRRMIKRLKVYPGTEHPHEAQNPKRIEV